jgi:protein arginine kinase activator
MLCEKCKKRTATVFYNENINGKVCSYSLCGECAAKLHEKGEIQDITSMAGSFADPFSELQDHFFSGFFGFPVHKSLHSEKKCPTCHSSYGEIAKKGKAGCADCYTTFAEELEHLIHSIHGTTHHTGSVPARQRAIEARTEQIKTLKAKLTEAVAQEDYETAARLRDEIRSLENGNGKEDKQ